MTHMQVTVDIPYASPPQGMKYFTIIGPHIDCMDEHYLVSFSVFMGWMKCSDAYSDFGKFTYNVRGSLMLLVPLPLQFYTKF